ncbi:hypothetical protein F4801DRAFT_574075 [Xylaria longipes]|nr:hypothetical protein F4801DRAFT_574075 [Xylaria longipes]
MLPSTPSSSASTSGPAPTSAFAPISTAASTEPSLVHRQQAAVTTTAAAASAAGLVCSPAGAPEFGAGHRPNDPNHQKRCSSPTLDGHSPDSSGSLPSGRDNVSATPQDQRTKKRRTGAGFRGVANLTPEQLAKKRANDREAQRAIRERTRNQIEALESRIRELTAQQPYQDLQEVIRQKRAVEAKNLELRAHLASIVANIQPLLSGGLAAEDDFASPVSTYDSIQPTQQQQQSSSYSTHNGSTPGGEYTPHSGVTSSWHSPALPRSASPPNSSSHLAKKSNQQEYDYVPNLNIGGEHLRLDFLPGPSLRFDRMQTGVNGAQDSPAYQHLPIKHDWGPSVRHTSHDDNAMASRTSPLTPPTQQHQYIDASSSSNPSQTPWGGAEIPIKHVPATCTIDNLLLSFMHERRQRFVEGIPAKEVVGPRYPSVSSLLNPENGQHSHPVSRVITDIISKFSALCRIPERVAVLYVMFRVMRWHISPTLENFELLPQFSKPLDVQYSIPHPAWVDYLPWPAMRKRFVHEYESPDFDFDKIFLPYTQTLSLNWPYEEKNALIETPDGSEIIINPVFREHFLRIENWTLGDAFDKACPALRGTYNLKIEGNASNKKPDYQNYER